MQRKILILVLFCVCACGFFDGSAYAAGKLDYSFPDYVAVENNVWRALWRTKKGDTYENNRGAEKVTEADLINLTNANVQLFCVKFKPNIEGAIVNGKMVARDKNTGKNVDNFCEEGYSVQFESGLAKGSMIQDSDGNWKLQVCSFYSENLQSYIGELADPNNITIDFVAGNNYLITFKAMDKYPGVFRIKNLVSHVYYDDDGNKQVSFEKSRYNNDVIRNGNSLLLPAGTAFQVEFYVNDASPGCTEEFVAQVRSAAPKHIPNPVLNYVNSSGKKLCQVLKEKHGSTDGVVTGMVPFCFRENVDYDEEIPSVAEVIEQVKQVDELLNGQNDVLKNTTAPTRLCNFLQSGGDGLTTTTGTAEGIAAGNLYTVTVSDKYLEASKKFVYWRASCTETMTVMYDDPKAVNAGGGFSYTTMIEINRTCKPIKIKTPTKKPQCEYIVTCWGNDHSASIGAGPTEEFDQCINTCDGGKYSQSCINSCYETVYGDTDIKTVSFTDSSSFGRLTYETKKGKNNIVRIAGQSGSFLKDCSKLGTQIGGSFVSSCYILGGNGGCAPAKDPTCPLCRTEHGVEVYYCDGCGGSNPHTYNGDAVQCYEVSVGSNDCVADPELDYYNQVKKAKEEYGKLVAMMGGYKEADYKDEAIYTGVYDNYLDKQVQFGKNQQPITDISVSSSTSEGKSKKIATTTQGGSYPVTDKDLTYVSKQYSSKRTQTVHLTQAYVSNTTNQKAGIGTIYQKKTMDCVRDDKNKDLCQRYYNGGYKYYTDLFAPTINTWKDWPYYNINNKDYTIQKFHDMGEVYENIDVDLRNFGSWNQWGLNIDCIYGLYQNYAVGNLVDCDSNKDICSGGIQYIYREIELEDNFPNERDPRWNWTGTIDSTSVEGKKLVTGAARTARSSYRNYNIDPLSLIKYIEGNGNEIYDVKKNSSEVDYEFVLTRQNLRNIRSYNASVLDFNRDGYRNYVDYDTSCSTKRVDGQDIQICTNNFLDDERYITYSTPGFNAVSRKKIAVCNNAKNQECYDVSSQS